MVTMIALYYYEILKGPESTDNDTKYGKYTDEPLSESLSLLKYMYI